MRTRTNPEGRKKWENVWYTGEFVEKLRENLFTSSSNMWQGQKMAEEKR